MLLQITISCVLEAPIIKKSITSPNIYKVNQKIHIGMMEVIDQNYTTLDQTLQQIAFNEFTDTANLQITQTNQKYVS